MRKPEDRESLKPEDFQILIPAFVISELSEAFQIGFVIFLPFLVIDMVVANVLLSLGMFQLSPITVSLPFKLLLFVLVDGWYLIARGLILGYT
jgi:type III secretion protein R